MATLRSFQDMLNEYLTNSLLKEELVKRDYVLNRVEKDNNWKGGTIPVPFKSAGASSVKFGGLTESGDIGQSEYVRGEITTYKEVWGSLIYNHTDILQHDGSVKEQSFLRSTVENVEDFMQYMKEVVSNQLTGGPHFATVTDATNAATGILVVDRIEKFMLNQKVSLVDDNTTIASYYVIGMNLDADSITLSAARGGTAANVSAFSVDQNAKFYYDGVSSSATSFNSLKATFLSAANGGSANVHGKSKLLYPFLQAINVSGADITKLNLLEKIFDAYAIVRRKARGMATEVLMSWKHFGTVQKLLEIQKGSYKVSEGSRKASVYGWTSVEIQAISSTETLKFVGIQELDDDVIMLMDWKGITFRSNGFFRKRTAPDGKQYYEVRASTGYQYIVDTCLFGELEIQYPGKSGIIHSINY
jgi:hypothetical protein